MKVDADNTRINVVIPVFDQLHYTQRCIESLRNTLPDDSDIVIVDNGSSDGTADYLRSFSGITVITNTENRGCAPAWNQGVAVCHSPWVVLLNNDTLLSANWINGLLNFATERDADIISPAVREGALNYSFEAYARDYVQCMRSVARMGVAHGVCFMVRRHVFQKVGLFDENFRFGQFEDADFFRRARQAGFVLGTTGRSFIHHFGSVTQDSIRRHCHANPYEEANRRYFRSKHGITLFARLLERRRVKLQGIFWRLTEKRRYGHTLLEKWQNDRLQYF